MAKDTVTLTPQQRDEALRIYASIMEEVKVRLSAIETGMGTARALLPPNLTSEFCFLQIRMICELVAMACLVAHGDITTDGKGKRLLNEWSAELIMTELGKLHPYFFPFPIKISIVRGESGKPGTVHFEPRTGQLTKAEFLTLYGRSGSALHRGTLNKMIGRKPMNAIGDKEIVDWSRKLLGLLNDHRIASWDNLRHFICVMSDRDQKGHATVAFAESPPDTSIDYAQSLFPKD